MINTSQAVIPAQAGIQYLSPIFIETIGYTSWTPASTGMTSVEVRP